MTTSTNEIAQRGGRHGVRARPQRHRDEKDLERWNPNADHAWFAGWAPAEDPEIAIVVLIEHGGAGGTVAWPIARQIIDGYFTKIKPAAGRAAGAPAGPAKAVKPAAAKDATAKEHAR